MDTQPSSPNLPSSPERPQGATPEVAKVPAGAGEGAPAPAPAAPAPKLSAADVAAAIAATPAVGPTPAPVAPVPGTAGDVDVIEPEWVDKAEQVVMQHQGDPYGEEEAIEGLQEEYLEKRYGIKVADPHSDGADAQPDTKPKGT